MNENTVPTRLDIETQMARVNRPTGKQTKASKANRNKVRTANIKAAYSEELLKVITSDLASYPQWEIEVDGPEDKPEQKP